MEFSVNLSKLGLDPLVNVGDPCLMPFRRILVKSRASTSFSAELKDFVGPFDFFRAPMAAASADIPYYCGTNGVSNISVNNPLITSLYSWTTNDGNILGDTIGSAITVNKAGSYIVSQQLMDSCGTSYARDTVVITLDPSCMVLSPKISGFKASYKENKVNLNWTIHNHASVERYELQRSFDNINFRTFSSMQIPPNQQGSVFYTCADHEPESSHPVSFYRLCITDINGNKYFSSIQNVSNSSNEFSIKLYPNPVHHVTRIISSGVVGKNARLTLIDQSGKLLFTANVVVSQGTINYQLSMPAGLKPGNYIIRVITTDCVLNGKLIKL
jgi:hypothetical protein